MGGTCTGRKRRSINIEGVPLADVEPSQLNQEVQSSQEDQLDREGRFLLYWITTTVSISGKVICTTSGIDGGTCVDNDFDDFHHLDIHLLHLQDCLQHLWSELYKQRNDHLLINQSNLCDIPYVFSKKCLDCY